MTKQDNLLETGRLAELGLHSAEMVHEIRQPLFAIKALAQLVASRVNGVDRAELMSLVDQVHRLERILERFSNAGRPPGVERGRVDLFRVAQAGVETVTGHAQGAEIELALIQNGPDLHVHGDPIAVQQIVSNLLHNAVDAARRRVEIRVDGCNLEIHDDGTGISQDAAPRLFEPFFTTKPPGKGTGLGLTIVSRLVEDCGANLSWDSNSEGTRFAVAFEPIEVASVEASGGDTP